MSWKTSRSFFWIICTVFSVFHVHLASQQRVYHQLIPKGRAFTSLEGFIHFPIAYPTHQNTTLDCLLLSVNNSSAQIQLKFRPNSKHPKNHLASAIWQDRIQATGWGLLDVWLTRDMKQFDALKAYCAGLLEGYLTGSRIDQFYSNTHGFQRKQNPQLNSLLRNVVSRSLNASWTGGQSWELWAPIPNTTMVERLLTLNYLQIFGMTAGYAMSCLSAGKSMANLDFLDVLLLSFDGDLDAVAGALQCLPSEKPKIDYCLPPSMVGVPTVRATASSFERHKAIPRCSALAKAIATTDGTIKDVFLGHTTWESFCEMLRIIKYYDLPYAGVVASKLAFSSYPGMITSTDDFFISSQGIALTETSLQISKEDGSYRHFWLQTQKLRAAEKTESIHSAPDFMKAVTLMRLTDSAKTWSSLSAKYSKTFLGLSASQWMCVDYKRLPTRQQNDLIVVTETSKHDTRSLDATFLLAHFGYLSSENTPWVAKFLLDSRETSRKTSIKTHATGLSNAMPSVSDISMGDPRAFTFFRLAPLVTDMESMKDCMQFSMMDVNGNATELEAASSVAPRFDLAPSKVFEGAVDSKVVDLTLVKAMSLLGLSGPEHTRHPPFEWSSETMSIQKAPSCHRGQPDKWDFRWQHITELGMTTAES